MKQTFLIFFSVLLFISCHGQTQNDNPVVKYHNSIDDINDAKQIEKLLKTIDKRYTDFKINNILKFSDSDCQRLSDSLKLKSFTKIDFDKNGYTDLLVIGEWSHHTILLILDSGGNKFSIKHLTRRIFQECSFPKISTEGNEIFIDYYSFKEPAWRNDDTITGLQSKRLIYKFGDFVEFNIAPQNHNIEKIEYSTTGCYGSCPIFSLDINSDRTAKFNATRYNEPDGKFGGIINDVDYSTLIALLNYIDFPNLKNNYSVNWTDDQGCTLTITYDNGKTKTINDYGLIGTYGLDRTYDFLFNLRKNQNWK